MEIYTVDYTLRSRDVNMFRRLRTSQLFEIMQETATDHSELIGTGIDVIRSKGLMWVVALQLVEISRMPEYGETVRVETWPGMTVHSLYPRYHRICGGDGEPIINTSAIWTLVDMNERKLVPSSVSGFEFGFDRTGREIALPRAPRSFHTDSSFEFTVPFSYVDMNGHMNNTRYFDLADNVFPPAADGRSPKRIIAEYSSELLLGEKCEILWGSEGERFFIRSGGDKPSFRIVADY